MTDFYIPLHEVEDRQVDHEVLQSLENQDIPVEEMPVKYVKTWHIEPVLLSDEEAALKPLPDRDYQLIKVVVDDDNKIKSASVVKEQKRVKTHQPIVKVTAV